MALHTKGWSLDALERYEDALANATREVAS